MFVPLGGARGIKITHIKPEDKGQLIPVLLKMERDREIERE